MNARVRACMRTRAKVYHRSLMCTCCIHNWCWPVGTSRELIEEANKKHRMSKQALQALKEQNAQLIAIQRAEQADRSIETKARWAEAEKRWAEKRKASGLPRASCTCQEVFEILPEVSHILKYWIVHVKMNLFDSEIFELLPWKKLMNAHSKVILVWTDHIGFNSIGIR